MTKSTITRERIEQYANDPRMCNINDEIRELARMALAAMDSEPVIVVGDDGGDALSYRRLIQSFEPGTKLYRHAQPLPVVNGEYGDAYQGAREDLAIWKRRALEAEESVRRLEQINDHLVKEAQGESRMGEPVIAQPAPVVLDAIDTNLIEALRLVQCMLDDYRERNYGDAQGWIRHINTHMSDYTEAHGDDAYSVLHNLITASPQSPGSEPSTVPGKWIPVSERMPDNTEPVLCIEKRADFGTYGQPFVCWHDGGGWVGKTNYRPIVTHWMPLPAAPQEVKSES